MNKNPLISFILPNYNNEHVLDLFFEKFIFHNTYDNYEFIIVDDGSEDNSLEVLYKWKNSGKIKNMLIIKEPHLGIINALNKALFLTKGEFIIRCDGDATIETSSFVEKFLEFYYINPEKIGVITSKVIADNGWLHALGRSVISVNGLLDRGKIPTEVIGNRKWDFATSVSKNFESIVNIPAEVDTALGVFTFFDRETAIKIGGFDKNYPLWIEDDDFFLSFRLYNKKCFYLPNIEICHRFSLRGNRNPNAWKRKKTFFTFKWLYRKNIKGDNTYHKLFNITFLKTKIDNQNDVKQYYIFNLKVLSLKYISWRSQILQNNYLYWNQKWGFNCLNPDLNLIKQKYKNTEILWSYDNNSFNIGVDILNKYHNLKNTKNNSNKKTKILLAYHKPAVLFKDNILTPIHLGRSLATKASKDGEISKEDFEWMRENMIGDDTGDNISHLNRYFCELTGMYWAWKNYDKLGNPDYIGFMHYRRFFIFNQPKKCWNIFDKYSHELIQSTANYHEQIFSCLHNDITVALPGLLPENIEKQYKMHAFHISKDFDLFKKIIQQEYPQYYDILEEYIQGHKAYFANMFIMNKELFFRYCDFMFSIVFKLHDSIEDYDKRNYQQIRAIGYLSETITGLFYKILEKEKLKIETLSLGIMMKNEVQKDIYPIFDKNSIPVVISCVHQEVKYLSVTLQSIIENSNFTNNYDIIVLNNEIDDLDKKRLLSMCPNNISIRFFDMFLFKIQNLSYNDNFFHYFYPVVHKFF
ncbi:DUF4422 domain-containing protein, partial [Campylobacter jejuni]|nr:DUF4422 domain-containing protein [Campylobacter jejuni]